MSAFNQNHICTIAFFFGILYEYEMQIYNWLKSVFSWNYVIPANYRNEPMVMKLCISILQMHANINQQWSLFSNG